MALYKFGARHYNPNESRWTQLDPSGQDYGYHYAGGDPINNVDPSGYITITYSVGFNSPLLVGGSSGIQGNGVNATSVVGGTVGSPGPSASAVVSTGDIKTGGSTCLDAFFIVGVSICDDGVGVGFGTPGISLGRYYTF